VVIGVGSVVSLMAIGEGARQAIVRQIGSLGENVIIMRAEDASVTFREELAGELVERVPSLEYATPVVRAETSIRWRRIRGSAGILGVNGQFPVIRDHEVISGRFFSNLHVQQRSRVAVVGYNYGLSLLGGRDPVDHTLTLGGRSFRIIGVLAPKGEGSAEGIDNMIVVPYTVAQQLSGTRNVQEVWGKAASAGEADLAMAQLSRIFRREIGLDKIVPSGDGEGDPGLPEDMPEQEPIPIEKSAVMETPVPPGEELPGGSLLPDKDINEMVTVTSLNQMLKEADRANRILSLLLGGIAAVSLLVGGIGIMNIMLVSVTERTAEIGLRKAVGAKRSDLLSQFLMEAFLLSALGGVLGLILGNVIVRVLGFYALEAVITVPVALVAFMLALVVGIAFGVYPAWLASGLQPVEALRHR
jgi:putative ABC transport system permease protein